MRVEVGRSGGFWVDGLFVERSDTALLKELVSVGKPMTFEGVCGRVTEEMIAEGKKYIADISGVSIEELGIPRGGII